MDKKIISFTAFDQRIEISTALCICPLKIQFICLIFWLNRLGSQYLIMFVESFRNKIEIGQWVLWKSLSSPGNLTNFSLKFYRTLSNYIWDQHCCQFWPDTKLKLHFSSTKFLPIHILSATSGDYVGASPVSFVYICIFWLFLDH